VIKKSGLDLFLNNLLITRTPLLISSLLTFINITYSLCDFLSELSFNRLEMLLIFIISIGYMLMKKLQILPARHEPEIVLNPGAVITIKFKTNFILIT